MLDICITEKYIKNVTPTTVPGNSTYSGITKHGCKICVVGDSYFKRIKQNDFTDELRQGKAFSAPSVMQMRSSYAIITFPFWLMTNPM